MLALLENNCDERSDLALEARDVILTRAVTPFEGHFGSGGTPYERIVGPYLDASRLAGERRQRSETHR